MSPLFPCDEYSLKLELFTFKSLSSYLWRLSSLTRAVCAYDALWPLQRGWSVFSNLLERDKTLLDLKSLAIFAQSDIRG